MREVVADDRRRRQAGTSAARMKLADRWRGPYHEDSGTLEVASLNLVRSAARSQWRPASVVLISAERGRPVMVLAAALRTDCTRERRFSGMPASDALPWSNFDKTSDTASDALPWSNFDKTSDTTSDCIAAVGSDRRTHLIWRRAAKHPAVVLDT